MNFKAFNVSVPSQWNKNMLLIITGCKFIACILTWQRICSSKLQREKLQIKNEHPFKLQAVIANCTKAAKKEKIEDNCNTYKIIKYNMCTFNKIIILDIFRPKEGN